jgi:hypothetical protein
MSRRITKTAAVATLAIAAFAGGGAAAVAANASGTPPVSTTTRTEVLVSPTCFHYHQVTRTWMHWSTPAHRYIPYSLAPRTTITDYTSCHA